ncbi:SdrD B-like domain-containing protein, partial [Listeria booriae]
MKNRTAKKVGTGILAGALVFGGLATSLPGYASAAENKVMAAGQGTISDVMFEDLNGNSVQDANETTGVAGIKVELYSDQGVQVGTVTTGTDGRYTFSNLADGTYYIHVDMSTLPANEKLFTTQGINGSDGNSSYFTITNGNTVTGYHFGFYPQQGAIQSYIYNDANGNGQKDGGEAGISNVHVALYNESGAKVADATTDGSGAYGFTALTPGRYYAKADIPANYQYKSSTYYGSDGTTGYFTVGSEQTLRNELNLGVATLNNSAVSGTITDASTGSGIANVTVELRDIQGNVVATQKTDGSGRYNFASLSSGDYYTRVTIPADYAYASGTGFGSDGNSNYIHLTGDNTASNYAMSLKKQANASVSGVVNTTDGSGLGNQNVSLYSVDGTLIKTITTAADGTFQFVSLPAGNYYVKAPIPAGYTFESSNGFGSDGNSYYLQVGASDAINGLRLTVNQQVGQIRSTVFSDANKNGTQESAETGVAGVTVSLYNTSGAVVATATTDNNGLYTFENVKPGYYYEKVTTPSGYTFLANSSFGSDGVSGYIQVQANQTRTDLNASLVAQDNPAEVSSAQWIYNKDGSKPAVNNGSILTISNDYYDSYSNKNINVQFYNKAGETVSTTGYTVAFSNPDLVKPVYSNSKLLAFTHSEKTGSTLVTVSDSEGKVVRTFTIVVTGSEVQATGIDLETTNIDATVGDTGKIAATVQPANATNKTLSYTPADASVISVDANGNWTALKAGTTTIAVKTTDGSNITKTVTVVVKDDPTQVSAAQWIYNKDGSKPAVNNGSILTISND